MLRFERATKEKSKLRLAIFGPSGSGKTYSALRIATGIGGNIAVIDTERGSASKYADRFIFDVVDLPEKTIEVYCEAMQIAKGYDVLIIDSLSHGWRELLQEVNKLALAKYRGNTWSAWSEGTPKQRQLIDTLLDFEGHIIATMRSKTEWTSETDHRGKIRPIRVGLAPEQGKGIEYEFDLLIELSPEHVANVIKDRTGKWQDKLIKEPDEEFGKALAAWLQEGVTPQNKAEVQRIQTVAEPESNDQDGKHWSTDKTRMAKFQKWYGGRGLSDKDVADALGHRPLTDFSEEEVVALVKSYPLKEAKS